MSDFTYKITEYRGRYTVISFFHTGRCLFEYPLEQFQEDGGKWSWLKEYICQNYTYQFYDLLLEAIHELINKGMIVDRSKIKLDMELVDQLMYDYFSLKDKVALVALEDYLKEQGLDEKEVKSLKENLVHLFTEPGTITISLVVSRIKNFFKKYGDK